MRRENSFTAQFFHLLHDKMIRAKLFSFSFDVIQVDSALPLCLSRTFHLHLNVYARQIIRHMKQITKSRKVDKRVLKTTTMSRNCNNSHAICGKSRSLICEPRRADRISTFCCPTPLSCLRNSNALSLHFGHLCNAILMENSVPWQWWNCLTKSGQRTTKKTENFHP